jgi:mono/diheme cytochrome c family protein
MAFLALLGACSRPTSRSLDPVTAGRLSYIANCASCHNLDPNLDGPLGPAIAGSSRALIEARVLHQAYPPGYHPKRSTHLMRAMPWTTPDLDNLTAFLAAAKNNGSGKKSPRPAQ